MFPIRNPLNIPCSHSYRKSNTLVLSDDLDEDSVHTLVDVALGGLHPEQCNEWLSLSQDIRDLFMQEKRKRKSAIARDITNTEDSLQRALREEVVDHVINLFPYVVLNHALIKCRERSPDADHWVAMGSLRTCKSMAQAWKSKVGTLAGGFRVVAHHSC